jgi:hypothetical protein
MRFLSQMINYCLHKEDDLNWANYKSASQPSPISAFMDVITKHFD